MNVDTTDLRYFLVVSEEQNISRAADRLFVSQPLLSQRLGRLEKKLGATLLTRHRSGVSLTAAGAALVPFAHKILATWAESEAVVSAHSQRGTGVVVLGFSLPPTPGVLAAVRAELARDGVRCRLAIRRIAWSDPSGGLDAGTCDLAVVAAPPPADFGLITRGIAWHSMVAVLPREHPLAAEAKLAFSALENEPLIAAPTGAGPLFYAGVGVARRREPPVLADSVDSADELLDAVEMGHGIAVVPDVVARATRRPGLRYRRVVDLPSVESVVAWRASGDRGIVGAALTSVSRAIEREWRRSNDIDDDG